MDGRNIVVSLRTRTSMGQLQTIYCMQSSAMRQFCCVFSVRDTLRPELIWLHYRLLIRIAVEK